MSQRCVHKKLDSDRLNSTATSPLNRTARFFDHTHVSANSLYSSILLPYGLDSALDLERRPQPTYLSEKQIGMIEKVIKPRDKVIYEQLDPKLEKVAQQAVGKVYERLKETRGYVKQDVIEGAFEQVTGKSMEEISKMPIAELDLNPKLQDQWAAVYHSVDVLPEFSQKAPAYAHQFEENVPLLSEYVRPGDDDGDGFLNRFIKATTGSTTSKGLGILGIAAITLGAATAIYFKSQNGNHKPANDYAKDKGLSDSVRKGLSPFDNDGKMSDSEKGFIDYLSGFDEAHQQKLVDGFAPGGISLDESHQIQFLDSFPKSEQVGFIDSNKHLNFDWDNDRMNNRFEKIVGLPYEEYNGRYALLVDTHENHPGLDSMYSFLINEQKFEPENVIKLGYTNATIENFKEASSKISNVANRNSFVIVTLESHANSYGLAFNDGEGINNDPKTLMSYEDIGKMLNPIESNMTLVSLFGCQDEHALNSLKITSSPNVVATMPTVWFFATSENYYNLTERMPKVYDIIESRAYDINGDGYVSVKESFDTQMKSMERYLQENPEEAVKFGISDPDKIAYNTYLGDFSVRSQTNEDG
ncbi:MAG: hypothetical protein V1818_00010 [Candidatus Aenigmatarchaeota archaeon]